MNVFIWHVHGSYLTSLVQGPHTYYVPVTPDRGPDGRGRARTWEWPDRAVEVTRDQARDLDVDVLVLQRPEELTHLAEAWLGRRPGALPTIYLEHNTPQGRINELVHPAADRDDLRLVHVTHFNQLFWDAGSTATTVLEHGIVDPGHRYTGELARAGVVVNEPVRRARVTGTDLLPQLAEAGGLDVFGMKVSALDGQHGMRAYEDLPQHEMHAELARRRVYVHPIRWTSLGLSLLEAMHLGMPVVALATTEAIEAVPPDAGVVSTRVDVLAGAMRELLDDPERARAMGKAAREHARDRYGLARFLADWDRLIDEVTA